MLYIPPTANVNGSCISGRGLARRRLSSKQRIELAADLACGELQLHPSLAQASSLVGVSQTKVRKELKARATARVAEPVANLVTAWNSATEDQRAEAIEVIGVGVVWDAIASVIR